MRSILQRTSRMHRSIRLCPFSNSNYNNSNDTPTPAQQHALFREQMEELKHEREALYGFTEQEQKAWGSVNRHRHSDDFLQQVEQARAEAEIAAAPSWSRFEESKMEEDNHRSHSHSHHNHHSHSHHHHNNNVEHSDSDSSDNQLGYRLLPPIEQQLPSEDTVSSSSSTSSPTFTHISPDGSTIQMVHVGDKQVTARRAVAQTTIVFPPEILHHGLISKKGPIFETAILAGIMAAKKTSDLIPLCHPLPLEQVNVDIQMRDANTAVITCECHVTHKTGVEMEAMVGASVAALTIYDMVKAISHNVVVTETKLLHKSGGKRRVD